MDVAVVGRARALDHDHRVGAGRDRGAGHDARRLSVADGLARRLARHHFLDDGQIAAAARQVGRGTA